MVTIPQIYMQNMMSKHKYIYAFTILFLAYQLFSDAIYAQNNNKKADQNTKKQSKDISVRSKIVDDKGSPVTNAIVTVGEGLIQINVNQAGEFNTKIKPNASLLIEALGYSSKIINVSDGIIPSVITLSTEVFLTGDKSIINLPLNLKTTQRALVGAVTKANGEDFTKYPDLSLSNTLQGRLMGVYVRSTTNGLGNNISNIIVRGLSRNGNDGALTLVDGIERPIDFINPEEVETIEVLKDATTKILYGSRAANGIILINTKRGKDNTRSLKVSTEYGINQATRLPAYLNSFDYASLYNEARTNDGLTPFYSPTQLTGYQNSTGENDQLYPNVDFYDYFIKNSAPIQKANINYSGGTNGNNYALVLGYIGAQGFEKVGKTPTQDRINLRGNLDFKISDNFKAFVDASGIVDRRVWSGFNQDQVFSALNSHRPNEYPIFLTDPNLLKIGSPLGLAFVPPLGGSFLRPSNLYGNLVYGGNSQSNYFYGQTNFGLDFNLNKVVKGFGFKTVFNFDNYQFFQSGRSLTPVTYSGQASKTTLGTDTTIYIPLQKRVTATTDVRQNQDISRNYGFTSTLSYQNTFTSSELKGSLTHFYYKFENQGSYQDIENTNTVMNLNYAIKSKIYVDGSLALMGSNKFINKNKFKLFPAVGLGWILSEENLLKDVKSINFLKLKGSFGVLGFDRNTDFYLFANRWSNNGTVSFREPNSIFNVTRTNLDLIGNPDLDWEKSREINIGIEGLAINNRLNFEFNYFNNLRYDIIINPGNYYSSLASGLFPRLNLGETKNTGFEGLVNWQTKAGRFDINFGANFIYSKNEVKVSADNFNTDANLNAIGNPSDVIFGYVSKGLFTTQAQINSSPLQTFGDYQIGDIAYEDLNGDNIIDGRDRRVIGNNFPRTALGLNVNLNYKHFGLYILGTSEIGVDNILNNPFYRNNGENKYSTLALERYHPTNNPSGSQPRLTTLNGSNNNVTSTFWQQSASFYRLKNAELSYQINAANATVKAYKLFLRGTNLFVVSDNKDLDPELINSGVNNYPLYRTLTFGASVKF